MKRRKLSVVLVVTAFLLLLWVGCDRTMFFDESVSVQGRSWHRAVKYPFLVTVNDTTSAFDFYVNLRHTGDYPYSNLFLFLHSSFPDGRTSTDTLELVLADSQGRWYGSGLGDLLWYRIPYKRGVKFPLPGVYQFELEQAMRVEALPAIVNVGFRVETSQPNPSVSE